MPLPLAPVAVFALRAGTVAAIAWAVQRAANAAIAKGRTDQRAEDALDDLAEGIAVHRPADRADTAQRNAAWRWRRTLRWGGGAGVEIDASLLGRLRFRRSGGATGE